MKDKMKQKKIILIRNATGENSGSRQVWHMLQDLTKYPGWQGHKPLPWTLQTNNSLNFPYNRLANPAMQSGYMRQ